MCGIVKTMKHTFKEERPDGSNQFSFPSGHTATAFTNAAVIFYEYKDANIWYASSGFLFAATTGFLRIANNKHYTSDVLAGAGIGIGVDLLFPIGVRSNRLLLEKTKPMPSFIPKLEKITA